MLLSIGILMVFTSSSYYSVHYQNDIFYYVKRQSLFAAAGLVLMLMTMNIDFRKWIKLWIPFTIITLILLILVLIIGIKVNGARSWIQVGSFSIQPSEFAKLAIIFYISFLISKKQSLLSNFNKVFLPALIVISIISSLILLQPDFGSFLIFILIASTLIFVSGIELKQISIIAIVLAVLGTGYILYKIYVHSDYRSSRLTGFLDPWEDPHHSGFQLIQSLYALGHGGITGTGFGKGIQKYRIPESYNDFIFPVLAEEFGLVGSLILICIYLIFIWRGIIVSLQNPEIFGKLLGVGIVSMIGFQVFINIGGVIGAIPLTGITLPFISYGGSSLLTILIGVGILLNISRQKEAKEVTTNNTVIKKRRASHL